MWRISLRDSRVLLPDPHQEQSSLWLTPSIIRFSLITHSQLFFVFQVGRMEFFLLERISLSPEIVFRFYLRKNFSKFSDKQSITNNNNVDIYDLVFLFCSYFKPGSICDSAAIVKFMIWDHIVCPTRTEPLERQRRRQKKISMRIGRVSHTEPPWKGLSYSLPLAFSDMNVPSETFALPRSPQAREQLGQINQCSKDTWVNFPKPSAAGLTIISPDHWLALILLLPFPSCQTFWSVAFLAGIQPWLHADDIWISNEDPSKKCPHWNA